MESLNAVGLNGTLSQGFLFFLNMYCRRYYKVFIFIATWWNFQLCI